MSLKKLFLALVPLMWGVASAEAVPVPGQAAPAFTGLTSKGETISLGDFAGKPVVLEWTNHDCPYVRKHYESGNMQRIQRALTEQGVVWISVISSAPGEQGHVSAEEAENLSARRGVYADHVLLDPAGSIGRLYGARTSPHMFLIRADGTLAYMGAIDDQPSVQASTVENAHNYVLAAWDAVLTGAVPEPATTKPYGCSVKYAE